MNRILSVTLCLFFIYLYIYKTYGKVKNTDEGLSNIYGAKYYLRSGLFNEKNGKGQKYEDLEEEKEGENDDEEDSNSEESINDEENVLTEERIKKK
ncbi:S-antigen protein [Plasmodium falciparum Santa Lucia]|uniref:S-antigen protein n=1 Tax=Plasmodium falciparum Santa Lucia TaxID=478859 RepID=W7G539_PLAFA|nr:S-antigen protein [Plasmodium falciparum Santa Lucia]